jgi:hypothetical protein
MPPQPPSTPLLPARGQASQALSCAAVGRSSKSLHSRKPLCHSCFDVAAVVAVVTSAGGAGGNDVAALRPAQYHIYPCPCHLHCHWLLHCYGWPCRRLRGGNLHPQQAQPAQNASFAVASTGLGGACIISAAPIASPMRVRVLEILDPEVDLTRAAAGPL